MSEMILGFLVFLLGLSDVASLTNSMPRVNFTASTYTTVKKEIGFTGLSK